MDTLELVLLTLVIIVSGGWIMSAYFGGEERSQLRRQLDESRARASEYAKESSEHWRQEDYWKDEWKKADTAWKEAVEAYEKRSR